MMQAQWYKTPYWSVETTAGTWIVPSDVCDNPYELWRYVEGKIASVEDDAERREGWVGRLSMPGYLDCTSWEAADTEEGIKEQLADLYDLCPEHMTELNEDFECDQCAELSE